MKVDAKMEVSRRNQNKPEDKKTVTSLGQGWVETCEMAQNWTIFVCGKTAVHEEQMSVSQLLIVSDSF